MKNWDKMSERIENESDVRSFVRFYLSEYYEVSSIPNQDRLIDLLVKEYLGTPSGDLDGVIDEFMINEQTEVQLPM